MQHFGRLDGGARRVGHRLVVARQPFLVNRARKALRQAQALGFGAAPVGAPGNPAAHLPELAGLHFVDAQLVRIARNAGNRGGNRYCALALLAALFVVGGDARWIGDLDQHKKRPCCTAQTYAGDPKRTSPAHENASLSKAFPLEMHPKTGTKQPVL